MIQAHAVHDAGSTVQNAAAQSSMLLVSHFSQQMFVWGINDDFLISALCTAACVIPIVILKHERPPWPRRSCGGETMVDVAIRHVCKHKEDHDRSSSKIMRSQRSFVACGCNRVVRDTRFNHLAFCNKMAVKNSAALNAAKQGLAAAQARTSQAKPRGCQIFPEQAHIRTFTR